MQNFEKATAEHAVHCPVKGKTTLSVFGAPSLDYILTCDAVFEHTYIHLIFPDFVSVKDVKNLNKSSEAFIHYHFVLYHA